MVTQSLKDPFWVVQPSRLEAMLKDLSAHSQVAVDTESNSLFAYREQVCLIQFSTPDRDYLVDPFSLSDLTPLAPFFSNPEIEKIFHAAEYDLICLRRDFGFNVCNTFDTMLAARILGRDNVGLGDLLRDEFGIQIDKRYQRANWGRRPLTPEMLAYARMDTHYLIPLRQRLKADLQARGRWEMAAEDFQRQCRSLPSNPPADEESCPNCWKISGVRELTTPSQMGVLQSLCEFRDDIARRADLPPFKVFGDTLLINVAVAVPGSRQELQEVPGMSPRIFQRHGEGLFEAVVRGKQEKITSRPHNHNHRPPEAYLNRLEKLKNWRKLAAQEMGVPSDVVLARDILEQIAQANPTTENELAPLMAEVPWRLEHYGGQILAVLN